jgi:SAM-dependent methyltransferase
MDMMPSQSRTNATYSLQWNRFRIIRPDEDRATFQNRTGLTGSDVGGALVLDAGCGMGRYLRVAAELGATVVGLDLSWSVQAARELTASLPGVHVVRGDLLRPPFEVGSFDHIYSLGVIDHTPDPRSVFMGLTRLLKPGGRIVVWVYPKERPALEAIIRIHRAISTRLPLPVLLAASRFSSPIGGLKRRLMSSGNRLVARLGVALNVLTIGVSMHPDPEVRVCDTLDWYAPKYVSRHTFEEVVSWFRDAGLVEITDLSQTGALHHAGQGNGINVAGRKPRGSDEQ